jgi:hypothetical protein
VQTSLTTTDDVTQTLLAIGPDSNAAINVVISVAAEKSDGSQGAAWFLLAGFCVSPSGVVTMMGTNPAPLQSFDVGVMWTAVLDTDGTLIRVRVTGAALTTVVWTAVVISTVNAGP